MRKKIYQLHRRLSIIIAIPVLLWAVSGFMHPIMTNIRPAIATQGIPPTPVDSSRLRFPLAEALRQHHMDSITNVRLVHIDTNWFYQVQPIGGGSENSSSPAGSAGGPVPVYLSCTNGNILTAGDWLYAQYLARQFLEGPAHPVAHNHINPVAHFASTTTPAHDCCGAATETVLNPVKGARVSNVSTVRAYNTEYKSINRLLPVYCVSFERPDGIRIYVETTQDRFSFAMDNRRAIFDEIFRLCHTWGWLDSLGKGRLVAEVLVALTALLTTVLGIYIFFTTRTAKAKGNGRVTARRNHRWTAIVASLFTLMWTFSGAFHAVNKFGDDPHLQQREPDHFPALAAFDLDWSRLYAVCPHPITNINLVRIDGVNCWRVSLLPEHLSTHKDLMKDGKTPMAPVTYIRAADYTVLPDGDAKYAASLACVYSGHSSGQVQSVTPVTSFNDEYNFTDKRLPVWKVSYAVNRHERLYIETSTGKLASRVNDGTVVEGYSFALLHKHHFMDWGGKSVRDASTMFWAFLQIVMVSFGLVLWFRRRVR